MPDEPSSRGDDASPFSQRDEAQRPTIPIASAAGRSESHRKIGDLSVADLQALIAAEIGRAVSQGGKIDPHGAPGKAGGLDQGNREPIHVNSGPPGFVNGGGHANFDPTLGAGKIGTVTNPGNQAGSHVNSGPPGFVNGGGHANFDPHTLPGKVGTVINPGNQSGSHVNSGPPGFVNSGGHANFNPHTLPGKIGSVINPGARAGSHVNSGPPGFVNGGGHANFDPHTSLGDAVSRGAAAVTTLTLPGGAKVTLPATGPVDLHVHGLHITR